MRTSITDAARAFFASSPTRERLCKSLRLAPGLEGVCICTLERISSASAALDTVGRDGANWALTVSSFKAHESHTRTGRLNPCCGSALRFVEHSAQKTPPQLHTRKNQQQQQQQAQRPSIDRDPWSFASEPRRGAHTPHTAHTNRRQWCLLEKKMPRTMGLEHCPHTCASSSFTQVTPAGMSIPTDSAIRSG